MLDDAKNIEEKVVPYIEDVLNDAERRQVDQVLSRDSDLSRDVAEIKQIVEELKAGFASGVKPPQERLSVEEVLKLSEFQGKLDSMPGTSEQKARLFCSDEAFTEFQLLRALDEEAKTETSAGEAPPIPEALLDEFRALQGADKAKVLPFVAKPAKLSLWKRAGNFLDRLDPKPLMASAAALVMLSVGVHVYSQPNSSSPSSAAPAELAIAEDDRVAPSPLAVNETPTGKAGSSASKSPRGPSGVTVFTSDDSSLLKEQTRKLLDGKVRYSVSGDRILVAENDVDQARDLLWSDGEGSDTRVAMGGEESETERSKSAGSARRAGRLKAEPVRKKDYSSPDFVGEVEQDSKIRKELEDSDTSEVVLHSTRAKAPSKRASRPSRPRPPARLKSMKEVPSYRPASGKRKTRAAAKGTLRDYKPDSDHNVGAAKNSSDYENEKSPVNQSVRREGLNQEPRSNVDEVGNKKAQEPTVTGGLTDRPGRASEARKQKLRDLALGRSKDSGSSAPPSSSKMAANRTYKKAPAKTSISRSSVRAPMPAEDKTAPVAQAVTREGYYGDAVANTVTRERVDGPQAKRSDDLSGDENGPVARQRVPSRPSAVRPSASQSGSGTQAAEETQIFTQQVQTQAPSAAPAPPPLDVSATGVRSEASSSSARVNEVRERQSKVAKSHNVKLTVTPRGTSITVFVVAKTDLSKTEKALLEKKIRKELGLLTSDTLVFR